MGPGRLSLCSPSALLERTHGTVKSELLQCSMILNLPKTKLNSKKINSNRTLNMTSMPRCVSSVSSVFVVFECLNSDLVKFSTDLLEKSLVIEFKTKLP